jgi:hypothetical protein
MTGACVKDWQLVHPEHVDQAVFSRRHVTQAGRAGHGRCVGAQLDMVAGAERWQKQQSTGSLATPFTCRMQVQVSVCIELQFSPGWQHAVLH